MDRFIHPFSFHVCQDFLFLKDKITYLLDCKERDMKKKLKTVLHTSGVAAVYGSKSEK